MKTAIPLALLACMILPSTKARAAGDAFLWWEGEDAAGHTFPAGRAFAPKNDAERDVLSAGDWLQTNKGAGATARWEVSVPEAGEYALWTRTFWKHGPFRWRWNGGEWTTCGRDRTLADSVRVRRHVAATWVPLGKVNLPAGKNALEVEVLPEARAVAFDAWVLAAGTFTPRGKLKPGEKYARAPEGWFPFEPDAAGAGETMLDIGRLLNEDEAGSRGRVIARGKDLVFEKTGEAVRFWSVVAGPGICRQDSETIDRLARRLARAGVNMVRWHIPGAQEREPGPVTRGLQYAVGALKKRGIYSYLLWYCTACQGEYTQLHYFDPDRQAVYRQWARCMLTTPNPHTGMPLAKDPAVVAVELLDEDSMFFYTFNPKRKELAARLGILEKRFGDWLTKRYGSPAKAAEAWGPGRYPKGDDLPAGRVAFYPAYLMTGADWAPGQRNAARARDQAEFFTALMREFYGGMKAWLREQCGYEGLVIGSNWKTADERVLGPLDQYANLAVDVTARNTYFNGGCKGPRSSYAIATGQVYRDKSLLRDPQQAILMHIQCADHPHMMTEGLWNMPNRFRTEAPFLTAAYYSLQGIDGTCQFAIEPDWLPAITRKWPLQTATEVGQYPAASLIYRRGYVREGPVVVNEALDIDELYTLQGGALSQPLGLDGIQAGRVPAGQLAQTESLPGIDPLSFLVGRVVRTIADEPGKSSVMNTAGLIDRKAERVTSATKELALDYGRGVATIDAPCARGAAGFLGAAGEIELGDVSVRLDNEYGAVMVVSLDGRPLGESGRVLVQVMTEERNYGWRTEGVRAKLSKGGPEVACRKILSVGSPPICVRKIAGAVSLKRPDAAGLRVTALDFAGSKRADVPGGAAPLKLLPDCLHYIIAK